MATRTKRPTMAGMVAANISSGTSTMTLTVNPERRLIEHAKLRQLMDEKRRIDNAIMTERLRLKR